MIRNSAVLSTGEGVILMTSHKRSNYYFYPSDPEELTKSFMLSPETVVYLAGSTLFEKT
jgi:hypothetical protein